MTRRLFAFVVILSLILQSLAHPAPVKAAQFLLWANGASFTTFGPNASITIDTGSIGYIGHCDPGADDSFAPFADVFIVPSGIGQGADLRAIDPAFNTVMGSTQGGVFVSEIIGFTVPSGSVGTGTYAVVYDECQDGRLDGEDFVLDPAFEVNIPTDVPDLPVNSVARVKEEAGAASAAYDWTYILVVTLAAALKMNDVWDKISIFLLDPVELIELIVEELVEESLDVDPIDAVQIVAFNIGRNYLGIYNDPPDADFRHLSPLSPRDRVDPLNSDPVALAVCRVGLGLEQRILNRGSFAGLPGTVPGCGCGP